MFPYPSGVGLHAGHPEGYTATDIVSRMKRMQGYNVLHPMGYDSFGLPAEQYAVTTGHHPNGFTQKNIETFSKQLKELGFDYDWSKMIATSDPKFYKWTQWIFKQLYLDGYAKYVDMPVNWCEELGTVLSNDEVIDGKSERGGFPVVRKNMKQWVIDQPAFAEKLLEGLDEIDWPESTKAIQRNWIGKSTGVEVKFNIGGGGEFSIYTTCIETIYGITFMVLVPDGQIVKDLMPRIENKEEVQAYIDETLKKNDMDRTELNKTKSGCELKGVTCINPVNGKEVRMFIGDFVLASYGTGAVMAVPSHDQRDFEYAVAHNIDMIQVIDGDEKLGHVDVSEKAFEKGDYLGKGYRLINSEEFTGLTVEEAKEAITVKLEKMGVAKRTTNYHFREWIFARQRYWGEPVPVVHTEDGGIHVLDDDELPLILPELEDYKGKNGKAPLENATEWKKYDHNGIKGTRETSTMPGSAGSSWYYFRYIDPDNDKEFANQELLKHWMPVDLYIGGTEHATGHLIYSRFWNKFLFDNGVVCEEEPFKKLINQGMIQGRSNFVYRIKDTNTFVSYGLKKDYDTTPIHVDVNIVSNDVLDIEKFKAWRPEFADAQFVLEDGKYVCGYAVEKMSKSMFNVVNPDDIVETYGADTLRLYEMFLGPLEQSKPWDTNGIDGVNRFLKKLWNLFYKGDTLLVDDEKASAEALKSLHKLIKKVTWDIEHFSYNTSVSAFMICVNELAAAKCHSREVLGELVVLLAPFAPHIAEELWHAVGNDTTVCDAAWPKFNEAYLVEANVNYAVSFNGKARFNIQVANGTDKAEVERLALENENAARWLEGKTVVKVIVVPNKIVNIVVK